MLKAAQLVHHAAMQSADKMVRFTARAIEHINEVVKDEKTIRVAVVGGGG